MSHILKVSEAASLALHSMALLASQEGELMPIKKIAKRLKASEAHLSKVLQALAKPGLVKSVRGPHGGFAIGKDIKDITLLEIFETIEGPLVATSCLFDEPICDGVQCILSDLLETVSREVYSYLKEKRLSEFTKVFHKDNKD